MLAEANTSGLTPWRICAASSSEPANDERTSAASNAPPYAVNAFFREAAAETVSCGLRGRPEDEDEESSEDPHPASSATMARSTTERRMAAMIVRE